MSLICGSISGRNAGLCIEGRDYMQNRFSGKDEELGSGHPTRYSKGDKLK